jgi:hypothetical protein
MKTKIHNLLGQSKDNGLESKVDFIKEILELLKKFLMMIEFMSN